VAKILVADDNSNVQKTVTLALAELGVDVVSVNNGEAAVRKLSGFVPDLVLADIFMPVRNGYEVCEYVKNDPRFSHIPVVLLVGAFDPLDEREAQRVGADGILKKPFVPTEPLITMVKTLLDRAMGERLVSVVSSPPATAAKAAQERTAVSQVSAPEPEISEEPSTQEFPAPVERIAFGEGERPIAFGSLLETPADVAPSKPLAIEPVDDNQILTSARDATLGDPIFWRKDSQEPEAEAEPAEKVSAEISLEDIGVAWKNGENTSPRHEEAGLLQPVEPLELVLEEQLETLPTIADSDSILIEQAAQSDLSVDSHKPEDLAANPIEWMASAPPQHTEAAPETTPGWDEPIPDATDSIDHVESSDKSEALAEPLAKASVVYSPHVSDQVAEEIPGPVLVPVLAEATESVANEAPAIAATKSVIPEPPSDAPQKTDIPVRVADQSATDTARSIPKEDWAALTASIESRAMDEVILQHKAEPSPAAKTSGGPAAGSEVTPGLNWQSGSPDPGLVEAVVQRVLEKMRPQVVDIITKEFLRPIVQALVHREIEKR
jgi:CheY-like chemotaxis protein